MKRLYLEMLWLSPQGQASLHLHAPLLHTDFRGSSKANPNYRIFSSYPPHILSTSMTASSIFKA